MLSAILEDLSQLPAVETTTLLNNEICERSTNPKCKVVVLRDEEEDFRKLASEADYSLIIAPELDDILLHRCSWVEQEGSRLLGPSPTAVRLAGDKYACGEFLRQQGVATPESRIVVADRPAEELAFPAVLKPRHGAGSSSTFLVESRQGLESLLAAPGASVGRCEDCILQPYVTGLPASVGVIVGPKQCVPLLAGEQLLSSDGRLRYRGGVLPLSAPLNLRARLLAERAVRSMPEVLGYVGVDLVLGNSADGSEDWVIEINPRLTTSYVGLRRLARTNLAEMMLLAASGREVAPPAWRTSRVRFDPDGRVDVGPVD
jgi:tyramine---L-glutamate ligase